MKVRVIASLVTALCLAFTGSAFASSIGVFFAADGSDCDAAQPGPMPFTYYICAVLGGDAAAGGITGAEFRVDGAPGTADGWFMSANPNPASNVAIGNPVDPVIRGCNIAFPSCQSAGVVLLYTITGFASGVVANRTMTVDRHIMPTNPQFPCSLLVLCDAPVFTKICVLGGQAFLNGGVCTVGVEETSWSSVKGLFN